jgi:hypothetical protein
VSENNHNPSQGTRETIPGVVPGERDPLNLTHREPGAIGGRPNGADIPPVPIDAMLDEETIHDHEIEGGGDSSRHRKGHRG